MVAGTDYGDWNRIWYVSESLPKHIATTRYVFTQFKAKACLDLDFNRNIFSQGIGDVMVTTKNQRYLIRSVTHTPNIGKNILSLKQLEAQGYEVDFKDHKCFIKQIFSSISPKKSVKDYTKGNFTKEHLENLQRYVALNMTRRVMKDYVGKYCDLVENSKNKGFINDTNLKQEEVIPVDLKGVVGLMDLVLDNQLATQENIFFNKTFDDMTLWFYKENIKSPHQKKIPPTIGPKQVCLLGLFKTLKELGVGKLMVKEE